MEAGRRIDVFNGGRLTIVQAIIEMQNACRSIADLGDIIGLIYYQLDNQPAVGDRLKVFKTVKQRVREYTGKALFSETTSPLVNSTKCHLGHKLFALVKKFFENFLKISLYETKAFLINSRTTTQVPGQWRKVKIRDGNYEINTLSRDSRLNAHTRWLPKHSIKSKQVANLAKHLPVDGISQDSRNQSLVREGIV